MASVGAIILALVLLLGGFPLLGRVLYKMENKQTVVLYLVTSLVINILVYLFTDHADFSIVKADIVNYGEELISLNWLYILALITFITAGIGVVGGILEFVGEQTESSEAYKRFDKFSPIKLYIYSLLYGYIFFFALNAFSEFLIYTFHWSFGGEVSFIRELMNSLQFNGVILGIIGVFLFGLKSFRYGLFSFEFYRAEFHPSVADISNFHREVRRFFALITMTMGLFIVVLAEYLLYYTPETLDIYYGLGKGLYFLAASIQTLLFYLLKEKYIDQLKPLSEQYEIKPGTKVPLSPDDELINPDDPDAELHFD